MIQNIKSIREAICNLIFISYLVGVVFIPIDLSITNKLINSAGAVSFILLFSYSFRRYNKNIVILFSGLLLLGLLDLIWYGHYKTNEVIYKNAYRGYLEAGKMLVFSSFTFLLLSRNYFRVNIKFHIIAALLTQFIVLLRAYYQSLYLHADRIPLSAMNGNIDQMGAATTAAYAITFCALYVSIVFLELKPRYKWIFFYANFVLTFAAIMMTGTRAAIVTYPFATIALVLIQYRNQKAFLFKNLGGVLALILGCGLLFSKDIEKRVDELNTDIGAYVVANNSHSSVGARLAMIQAGIKAAPQGFAWQSLEQRADNIFTLSKKNSIYQGATEFLNVHMHNEIIEALSTKGVAGVVFLCFFYAALIIYCVREKKYPLLVFPASIMLFGLSDVITHDKPIPAAWIVCFFLAMSLLSRERVIR